MTYLILECGSNAGLMPLVQDLIDEGWKPHGGVAVTTCYATGENQDGHWGEERTTWAQAMVKE